MPFARALAGWLGRRLGLAVEFIENVTWQERELALYRGEIDLCWICGLPYVRRVDRDPGFLEVLAAPVPAGARYADRPVYFSDVVVPSELAALELQDLRGARWTFNEPNSHSGYNVLVAAVGSDFFGEMRPAGSHQEAMRRVAEGASDAAAIDSTVLETETRLHPDLAARLRVIHTLGPSPAPPWVCRAGLPRTLRRELRQALDAMAQDSQGRAILAAAALRRLAPVRDADYDRVREIDAQAKSFATA